ncbi:MAG: 2-oxoacid:ferredoxin oxidoreductase subunit beta [Bacillota bacterium]
MPHIWCPGCGHGTVLGAVIRAIDAVGLDKNKVCIVSGIGCASRAPGYMDFDTLHTTHGRALAFATGIKLAKPELNVIVLTGDGDLAAIGGNHFIHAARRNIGITTICFNNSIYGMTSGQFSPMTPKGHLATTAPYGNIDRDFDLCDLARAAGATYVARSTAFHARQLSDLIAKGMRHDGFAFIEAVTQCPTYYGRKNKIGDAIAMLNWMKERAIPVKAAERLSREELKNRITTGELYRVEEPEYSKEYDRMVAEVMAKEESR